MELAQIDLVLKLPTSVDWYQRRWERFLQDMAQYVPWLHIPSSIDAWQHLATRQFRILGEHMDHSKAYAELVAKSKP